MINFTDFSFRYNNSLDPTLSHINLQVSQGEYVLIMGPSGSGKSTLLRAINGLIPHFFGGNYAGNILINGKNPLTIPPNEMAKDIGYLFQNPDNQLLMEKVIAELAFGLENLAIPSEDIETRIQEITHIFSLQDLIPRSVNELSGGQKQTIALASLLVMQPKILLLDEPTSELDPHAARRLFSNLSKLNSTGNYIIMIIEHNIAEIIQDVDQVVYLDGGEIQFDGNPQNFYRKYENNPKILKPALIDLSLQIRKIDNDKGLVNIPLPLSQSQFLKLHSSFLSQKHFEYLSDDFSRPKEEGLIQSILSVKDLSFAYSPGMEVLSQVSFNVATSEIICIIGRNGSGKTTLLKNIIGLLEPSKGTIRINKNSKTLQKNANSPDADTNTKVHLSQGYVFQNPSAQFFRDSVRQELEFIVRGLPITKQEKIERVNEILRFFHLTDIRDKYPRFISLGEQQRLALATALIVNPQILLIDEPTHGMDAIQKTHLLSYLRKIQGEGCLILIATHDHKFASSLATRILYLDNHKILFDGPPNHVLPYLPKFTTIINDTINKLTGETTPYLTVAEVMEVVNNE
ncbi:MAG: ABC transporter ATP-binding protein [Promethearchaeota archaeon]